ncbi:MAG: D-alanyl-D-alanine carboxypeptidase [Rhodospirillaceae bacterium]|nr:D-alanyl-D-alanine carboxypeptidase [Rhodospirillaceae bacterium]MBT5940113.1 D-alanyl-D-alanine carboxypeptidase [Rhodospirillaceae bacterium]MBT7265406.1 D-alanyl-D-alanine carboxypeptidase [Rhodospirillaceae bacterium]
MRLASKILCLLIGLTAFLAGNAEAKYAAYVVDAKTGKVFHAVNENTRNYPASLTKLMTLYLLFEAVEKKRLNFSTRLAVSRKAANRPASRLGLKPGQSIRVKDAVMALIVKSANDVASVVAESVGGNEKRFALRMTDKARKLGMSRTTFRNASGLPHRGQMSTAKDMATLTRAIINRFPQYYHLFSRQAFTFEGRTYRTHNKVLKTFPGAEGMKTGYIRASGFNLITTAKRSGKRVIGVVFGGNTSRSRNRHMKTLLTRAFSKTTAPMQMAKIAKPARSKESSTTNKNRIWGIQVGAFYTHRPALNIATDISNKYASVLNGGKVKVMPLRKSRNRVLYRARILGLNRRNAYRTCRLLKKHRKPCLALNLPSNVEVASR